MLLKELQGDHVRSFYFPGHATAGSTIEQGLFRAPFRCAITAVDFTPNTTQAGANTNTMSVAVRNRTTAAGSAIPASLAFVAGVDLTALTKKALTISATAADVLIAEDDLITAAKTIGGTGLECPAGIITVHFKAY